MNTNNSSLSLTPIETQKASVAIYEQIKEKILSGELKPGEYLPSERQMMEMLKRSRPTIREALRMLEQSGFIKTTIGTAGPIVQDYSIDNLALPLENIIKIHNVTIWEVYEYRMKCERFVVAWAAARRTEDDLKEMKKWLDLTDECISKKDYAKINEYDVQFHTAISKASRNRIAEIINTVTHDITEASITDLINHSDDKAKLTIANRINRGHKAIYKAIERQDEAAAKAALSNHLETFSKDYKKVL